jgi:hypothetical protein
MPSRREPPTLADYVGVAISPALIVVLIVSLVYFLLEVLYGGQYAERLHWILFFFVVGAVLIARISMQAGIAERSGLYGLLLAAVTFLALQSLVEYPPTMALGPVRWLINLALMGLIWWCAHRLTWDCTYIDETVDASGAGLLDVAGLDAEREPAGEDEEGARQTATAPRPKKKASTGLVAWWERYESYRAERRRRPHTPGVWVVYFSLAALPLFGLGQTLIPPEAAERRRYAFWLMGAYVASGLGLMLTTTFLGLRRYLRQRKLRMPLAMTGVWLTMGGALIVVLLALGAFLPRPDAEYALFQRSSWSQGPARDASRIAPSADSPGKGEGQGGSGKSPQGQEGKSGVGDRTEQPAPKVQGESGQDPSKSGPESKSGGDKSGAGGDAKTGERRDEEDKDARRKQADGGAREERSGADAGRKANEGGRSSGNTPPTSPPPTPPPSVPFMSSGVFRVLKWVVFGLGAIVTGIVVLRAVLRFLANFTGWARGLLAMLEGLWQSLFSWLQPAPSKTRAVHEEAPGAPPPRPFDSFRNPFWSKDGRSPGELIRYSFGALEAWARERGWPRQADETPLEFADRLGGEVPALAEDVRRLTILYARTAYSRGALPASALDVLRRFWQQLESQERAPASR